MTDDKKTIIMVDDNMTNLAIGMNTLKPYYSLITLNSGARLLKALEKVTADLILIDIEMPEMDGFETVAHIKSKNETSNIPIIFLTGKSDDISERKGYELGAVDYIKKPFTPTFLLERIELHLRDKT